MTSSMMAVLTSELLVWYNAVFVAIFGVGFLFTFLQLVGLGGESSVEADAHLDVDTHIDADLDTHVELDAHVDADADLDHDVEAHVDHDVDGDAAPAGVSTASAFGQLLGLGKVPLSASLMVLCYTVGLAGFLGNQVLGGRIASPSVYFPMSLLMALVAGFVVLRMLSGVMARYVPSFSTSVLEPRQLVGLTAQTVLPVSARMGLATLHDKYGTLHTVRCCTTSEPIEKGQNVVLVRYLPESSVYVVGKA